MNTLYSAFIKLNDKIKSLEEERDMLRASIVDDMRKEKVTKKETDWGIFTRAIRANWSYTQAVSKLKEKVKLAEVREQNTGKAKKTETEYLRFTNIG